MQRLARAFDGELLLVQQVLDAEKQLDVFAPIQPMAGAGLLGRQNRELGFPIAQDVRLDSQELAYLADLEVQLIRDLRGSGLQRYIRHEPSAILAHSVAIVTTCWPRGRKMVRGPARWSGSSAPSISIRAGTRSRMA